MRDFGILGMNARNLQYIKKFNSKKAIRLADDKLKTRRFMEARGIPVPQTFDVIRSRHQLYTYNFRHLPVEEFIVKPNMGSRGRGIYRVKMADSVEQVHPHLSWRERTLTMRSPYWYETYKISGNIVDDTSFRRYLMDILDGKNSLGLRNDTILLEELLLPGSGFERYCEWGLADIRIIIHNLVPVAAMLRVPTEESDGKANLDRGAIGFGVEIGSGKIFSLYQHGRVYKKRFPKEYAHFEHRQLPYREDILMYSSKIQYFVNLGFLALDWVITEDGPKLLEINARAGLKFQLASLLPLKQRLKKIGDIKVTTPEKGVQIAQSLFNEQKSHIVTPSKVVYLSQHGTAKVTSGDVVHKYDVVVQVDVQTRKNYISKNIFTHLQKSQEASVQVEIKNKSIVFKGLVRHKFSGTQKNRVILGKDAIDGYYLKPIDKIHTSTDFLSPKNILETEVDQLVILDQKISRLAAVLNISRILKPLNFLEELDTFITHKGKYNPRFEYRRPSKGVLSRTQNELHRLHKEYFSGSSRLQSKFARLFEEKISFLLDKVEFITAYKSQNLEEMLAANRKLYGPLDDTLITLAKNELFSTHKIKRKELGHLLPIRKVKKIIEKYLADRGLKHVKVIFDSNSISRMSVSRGEKIVFRINHETPYREKSLYATLAHEIDVHVRRHQMGVESGRHILKSGTARYIVDEEGLAIYHSNEVLPDDYEKMGMYEKYFLLSEGTHLDFSGVVDLVRSLRGKSLAGGFKTAFRIKKGLEQTFRVGEGSLFYKDKIYLDGYMKVSEWIENGGHPEELMIGKIKIDDLKYIK